MRPWQWPLMQLQAQQGALFPWLPVGVGIGIALFFNQKTEPSVTVLWGVAACVLALTVLWFLTRHKLIAILFCAFASVASGFVLAGWRAHDVAAPVLGWRYYGPIEGRVVGLDRSSSDSVRVTLDRVRLSRLSPERTPGKIRISLHGDAAIGPPPTPGARVMTTGHLSPPGGPVEPGGFDFQRHSWFKGMGAIGYTRIPLLGAGVGQGMGHASASDFAIVVFKIRMAVSRYVIAQLPGDVGGFAAAVTSGDRSGMTQKALQDLRASNLAHLLAISGLHMGLLTGFVFSFLRIAFALIPWVALHWPTRRLAALGALIAGAGYLSLSGGNVATERAFIMAAVALLAVMLNRRAISLRSVAIAALVVLFLRPEAMLGPGFQMSFAATIGLVAAFNAIRDAPWRMPKWIQPVSAVFLSSGIAGLATAPYAAAHFNAYAHYGLLANVISVPVMGLLVVPAAVIALCVAPLGLAPVALTVMGWGLAWILEVAAFTAALPGARSFVPGPDATVLPILTLGALFVIFWQGRGRFLGVVPVLMAFALWINSTRPDVLIAGNGGLVGVMTDSGRALSKARGGSFAARNWLENDGDAIAQDLAFARWSDAWPDQVKPAQIADLDVLNIVHITGKRAAANPPGCSDGILVTNTELSRNPGPCQVFDPDALEHTGSVALHFEDGGGVHITTARDVAGDRMWSGWPKRRRSVSAD
ncbi:MAG: ComEC/Rec2 family competence protein [Paracoccaceae bacterium]